MPTEIKHYAKQLGLYTEGGPMPEMTPILDLCGIVDSVQLLNEGPPIDALRGSNKVVAADAHDVSPILSPKAKAPGLEAMAKDA